MTAFEEATMDGAEERSHAGRKVRAAKGADGGAAAAHAGLEPARTPSAGPGLPLAGRTRHEEARGQRVGEIAALVRLAELDAALVDRGAAASQDGAAGNERRELTAKLSAETLEAYNRALRAGRVPPVARLAASVCSGCHMRLHSKLDQQVRQRRGFAPCPYCLRLVYDPAWLAP
jgi:hypothetical protein